MKADNSLRELHEKYSEEDKRKYRDEHFATDLKNAYELGKRLVGKCQEG